MKDIGLVGVPGSGKSTLFTALTRTGAAGGRANQAVVQVPDPRPAVLARLEDSKKIVQAQVRFVDVPGGATAQGLAALREADALCVVVRAFEPGALGVWAEIEAEAAALTPEEAGQLLEEFGVTSPGLDRVVAASYRALDLITFLTTGPDESRAWEVRRGATVPEAAGVIHTDL